MVSGCSWEKVVADLPSNLVNIIVIDGFGRERAAHDIAVDIAASCDGSHESFVDGAHCGLQLALDDSVELERLAGCHFHRLVAVFVAYLVHLKPL